MKLFISILIFFFVNTLFLFAQKPEIPSTYSNIHYDEHGLLYYQRNNESKRLYADTNQAKYSVQLMLGKASGSRHGIILDFDTLKGSVTFGLIPYSTRIKLPTTVYRKKVPIKNGKAELIIDSNLKDSYEMARFKENGQLAIGYRVQDQGGSILYDGVISVVDSGPFKVVPTIYNGPYLANITHNSAIIWFETHMPVKAKIYISKKPFGEKIKGIQNGADQEEVLHHEIKIDGLAPGTIYYYRVYYGNLFQNYYFKTAPTPGSRKPFVFAFTSDCLVRK